jgi:DNA-binding NarL/FixJ family response regulator
MAVNVLLAHDSDIMRGAIVRSLKDKPRIKAVAEAVSFAKIMQMRKHAQLLVGRAGLLALASGNQVCVPKASLFTTYGRGG